MILRFHDVSGPLSRRKDLRHWKFQRSRGAGVQPSLMKLTLLDRALELGRRGNLGEGVLLMKNHFLLISGQNCIIPRPELSGFEGIPLL